MKREICFSGRFVVVWDGFLTKHYLQEFLPGGTPRWSKKPEQARVYADKTAANKASTTASRKMKRLGIPITVIVEPRTLLD